MYFIILAEDKPDSLELRMSTRPVHLDYAAAEGCVVLAGPLLSEGAEPTPRGSLLIVNVDDHAAAQEFAVNDPYALAGLFAKVEIKPWMPAVGPWKPDNL